MFFLTLADDSSVVENDRDKLIEQGLKRISRGNKDAIGDIYELTKTGVYGFILSILKNPEDAEDVMQDTYIKICSCADMYMPQGKPMAWIFTIARNLCLMKLRRSSRQVDIPDFEWDSIEGASGEFGTEDRIVLEAALSSISEEESQIVMLHAVAGMKHRELADFLDMPLATVLSKYNRALKKLQKALGEDNK